MMNFVLDTPLLHWIENAPRCDKVGVSKTEAYPSLPYGLPWFWSYSDDSIDDWKYCRGVEHDGTFFLVKTFQKEDVRPASGFPIIRVNMARIQNDAPHINKLSLTWETERKNGPMAIEAHKVIIDNGIKFKNISLWWNTSFGHIQREFTNDRYPEFDPFSDSYLQNVIDQVEMYSMTSAVDIARKFS